MQNTLSFSPIRVMTNPNKQSATPPPCENLCILCVFLEDYVIKELERDNKVGQSFAIEIPTHLPNWQSMATC